MEKSNATSIAKLDFSYLVPLCNDLEYVEREFCCHDKQVTLYVYNYSSQNSYLMSQAICVKFEIFYIWNIEKTHCTWHVCLYCNLSTKNLMFMFEVDHM